MENLLKAKVPTDSEEEQPAATVVEVVMQSRLMFCQDSHEMLQTNIALLDTDV